MGYHYGRKGNTSRPDDGANGGENGGDGGNRRADGGAANGLGASPPPSPPQRGMEEDAGENEARGAREGGAEGGEPSETKDEKGEGTYVRPTFLALCLSSRRNMCINEVSQVLAILPFMHVLILTLP